MNAEVKSLHAMVYAREYGTTHCTKMEDSRSSPAIVAKTTKNISGDIHKSKKKKREMM
jgi:hypothetical protein